MAQQGLSPKAQEAIAALKALPPTELEAVVAIASVELATKIAGAAEKSTPENRAAASSALTEGIQVACNHGFERIQLSDGSNAIKVKITRPTGQEAACLLSEGARGKWSRELATYGKDKLKGASLLTHADFAAVVGKLYTAIKGHKVVNGVLRTEDAALNEAYKIVTQGVRRHGGFSWATFHLHEGGAGAACRVDGCGYDWDAHVTRCSCALFGVSPAESK